MNIEHLSIRPNLATGYAFPTVQTFSIAFLVAHAPDEFPRGLVLVQHRLGQRAQGFEIGRLARRADCRELRHGFALTHDADGVAPCSVFNQFAETGLGFGQSYGGHAGKWGQCKIISGGKDLAKIRSATQFIAARLSQSRAFPKSSALSLRRASACPLSSSVQFPQALRGPHRESLGPTNGSYHISRQPLRALRKLGSESIYLRTPLMRPKARPS